jgi:cobalt-zinc-cadmium efflux system outer membrane protein
VAEETRRDAPELALSWVRERGDASVPFGNSLGVKFTYPFSSEPRTRQNLAAARAEALQNDAAFSLERQRLEQETTLARRAVEQAEQRLALMRERQGLLADNLNLAEKAFALGETDLASRLRARAAAQETRSAMVRQSLERDAAVSHLLQTLGVMP